MFIINAIDNAHAFLHLYRKLKLGYPIETRGAKCLNLHNCILALHAWESVFTDFVDRKPNLNYAKKEWLWYLGADKFDQSIEQHATMWKKLRQPDGSYFSNYGQYMFHGQFDYVVETLRKDPDSRRACMTLLQKDHLFEDNIDTVCTYAIHFTIHDNLLHMTVMMRSNDAIFGLTNDAFCFQQLMLFVCAKLKSTYPLLDVGQYLHMANSMHVYERHFEMVDNIITRGISGFQGGVAHPTVTSQDVDYLIRNPNPSSDFSPYVTWLTT